MPDLIEVQKNSYERFLKEDLREVLADVSPITDYTDNLVLEFVDYSLDEPKNSVERCKERDMTYAAPLKVFARLKNRETGEIKESDVFMGDFPLMWPPRYSTAPRLMKFRAVWKKPGWTRTAKRCFMTDVRATGLKTA